MCDLMSTLAVMSCAFLGMATVVLWAIQRIARAAERLQESRERGKVRRLPRRWRERNKLKPGRAGRGPARQNPDGTWSFGWPSGQPNDE